MTTQNQTSDRETPKQNGAEHAWKGSESDFQAGDDQASRLAHQIARKNSIQDGVSFLRAYLSRRPKSPLSQKALANLLTESGRLGEALGILSRLALESPQDASVWNSLGCGLILTGDITGAEAALLRAVDLEPGRSLFQCNLAEVKAQRGDFSGAEQALLIALREASEPEAERIAGMLEACRRGRTEKC